jgi:hypothetical protein
MFDIQLMGLLNATLQAATLLFIAALGRTNNREIRNS